MITGKCLVTVTHVGGDCRDVNVTLFTCSAKEGARDWAQEMIQLLGEECLSIKADLNWGDSYTMKANYAVHFIRGDDWTSDDDVEVYFTKVRVLYKRQAKENKPENLLLVKVLKQKVIDFCLTFPGHSGVKQLVSSAETTKLPWSVQANVELIRSMVPEAFPRPIRKGPIKVEMNIHGAWRVVPDTRVDVKKESIDLL